MEKVMNPPVKKKFELSMHLVLSVLSGFLVYICINIYVKKFTQKDNEEISLTAMLCFLGAVYTGRFLSQLWIPKNKKVPNLVLLVLPVIMAACIFLCVQFAGGLLSHPYPMRVVLLIFSFIILALAAGMLIKLVRIKINSQLQEAQANVAHSQSELHLLQSQLSPHFLFNTLNNIYGISITQHEKVPAMLLKLSDLLRYCVYDTKELFVPLGDELNYVNNYIDFEKIRLGERLMLTADIERVADLHCKIAPMLLIVFVENAFKHSKNNHEQKIFIDIGLKLWADTILFSVKNSHKMIKTTAASSGQSSGFGLASVWKRLELLYPNQFDLKITEEEETYSVMLRLSIK
ncbi:MAG: sensor histidine kinase [Ferruginibacter sp.]